MHLSESAIKDLRLALIHAYGTDFNLQDSDLDEIGLFLLTSVAETLKYRKHGNINKLH